MPIRRANQSSFFTPTFLDPGCVEVGSVPWVLWKLGAALLPGWMAVEWRGHETTTRSAGRAAWPARTLFALHTLRWSERGCSRLAACRRAKTDLAWRAAMGLDVGTSTPTESTMREFERWLQNRAASCDVPRYLLLHEHVARRTLKGVTDSLVVAVDSTPMWCFGALRGTLRLLGDGLRGLARKLSRRLGLSLGDLAKRWSAPWLTARSMKGGLSGIDWCSAAARSTATDEVVRTTLAAIHDAKQLIAKLPQPRRGPLVDRCLHLLKVVADDFEEDEDGHLIIARRVAADRIVSITDPDARSGRKTRSQPFKGYRLHVLGDVCSGVILAVDVVPANTHDARVGESLIVRARRLVPELDQVLADTAYGATAVRVRLAAMGVDLVAPPQMPDQRKTEGLRKEQFVVDFDAKHATCPQDVRSVRCTEVHAANGRALQFHWARDPCSTCSLRSRCAPHVRAAADPPPKRGGRARTGKRLLLHPQEEALRAARAQWRTPERRALYRRRAECELLIANAVRSGARQARAWGIDAAILQAHSIAIHLNLAIAARQLAAE